MPPSSCRRSGIATAIPVPDDPGREIRQGFDEWANEISFEGYIEYLMEEQKVTTTTVVTLPDGSSAPVQSADPVTQLAASIGITTKPMEGVVGIWIMGSERRSCRKHCLLSSAFLMAAAKPACWLLHFPAGDYSDRFLRLPVALRPWADDQQLSWPRMSRNSTGQSRNCKNSMLL